VFSSPLLISSTDWAPFSTEQASVFISVAHEKEQKVLDLLKSYDWPRPKIWLSRMIEEEEERDGEVAAGNGKGKLFYNPSGLIEYEFDRIHV
jgi:hypothetical protein